LFLSKKEAWIWFLVFLSIIVISAIFEPKLNNQVLSVPNYAIIMFYVMNLVITLTFVFLITFYFLNNLIEQRERNIELLKITNEKQRQILDSINYAKRIQRAILPPTKLVSEYLHKSFILYKPKDIVSGDFYWIEPIEKGALFAAADCTGHGVSGAMVSVVCNNALNRSVREFGLTDPGQILNKTKMLIIQEFEKSKEIVEDGMDIALCKLEGNTLSYSGANNPLWLIRNGEILETKADKQPIGLHHENKPFTTRTLELQKGDSIYIFSDGYSDQFGGNKGKKYMSHQFKGFLISIQKHSMEEQHKLLDKEFESWKGQLEQVDDVCVIGLRI
ncbi:MAG: SpoIIE family protein phosphatase, partial [Flavobacteriales bacterium]|nr:SpoIIE family protein phosphatase [Flavobacteriales bacterium]